MRNALASASCVIADEALTSWLLGRRKPRSYFSPFVDQRSLDYVSRCGREGSLQRRFPIVDILFRSGHRHSRSRCEVVRNRAKKHVFRPANLFTSEKKYATIMMKQKPSNGP